MVKPKLFSIPVNCAAKSCPQFATCAQLPTEIVSYTGKIEQIRILFVGQGGGADEERLHRPFVGISGQRLRSFILEANKHLKKVFNYALSNNVRCHPEGNRAPTTTELKFCLPYLKRDIKFIKPGMIIALGKSAINCICKYTMSMAMSDQHGTVVPTIWEDKEMPDVMVAYHPSPLNTNPEIPRMIISDIVKSYQIVKKEWQGYSYNPNAVD
jgi:DNA polymerase